MPRTRTIRILVLGDSGVGKTSFINAIFSETSYPSENFLEPVLLPPNFCLSCPDVYTELVDSQTSRTNLAEEAAKSDIILLMYDVSKQETIDRLSSYWLRVISGINSQIPVVLCGNKFDQHEFEVRNNIEYKPIRQVVKAIAREFTQVQMGMQCSSKYNKNLGAVLNHLQVAVLYPLTPLYNVRDKSLTDRFRRALTRIFRVLDEDTDGYLSDSQLKRLEQRVFNSQLNSDDIGKIKNMIKIELESYDEMAAVNLEGFIAMNYKCVHMKNMQICWGILHNFGYNEQLDLVPNVDRLIIKENSGSSVELKDKPKEFLIRLFQYFQEKYQQEPTNARFLDEMFYPSNGIPLEELIARRDSNHHLSLEEFFVAWSIFANRNYQHCYEFLSSIGYEGQLEETFLVTPSKLSFKDMEKIQHRTLIYVGLLDTGGEQSELLKSYFVNSTIQEEVQRSYFIYSGPEFSKVFVLYRLTPQNLVRFFRNVNPYYGKLLDVVVYFEDLWQLPQRKQLLRYAPESIMRKRLGKEELNSLQIRNRPAVLEMNLLESSGRKTVLLELMTKIWDLIVKPQDGYSPEKLAELKKLNKRDWNLALFGTILAVGGVLAYKLAVRFRN